MLLHGGPITTNISTGHVPAPVGGINRAQSATQLPPSDCLGLVNLVPNQYGLQTRSGWREWATELTGAQDDRVRTIVEYHGSEAAGSSDKLFALTDSDIWDVSNGGTVGGGDAFSVHSFSLQTGDAGWAVYTKVTVPGGHFLVLCCEVNGLHYYSESDGTWAEGQAGGTVPWAPTTLYEAGNLVVNDGNVYQCTLTGTSAGSGGPTGVGSGITDNTTEWDFVAVFSPTNYGTSLADQQAGLTFDPRNMVAVCVWKDRIWLVERNTTRAWYGGINAIFGTFTSFDFGLKLKTGGPLVNLYNWSYDGGSGMDTLLVGISTSGDVIIYQGSDPTSADTFGLKGCWSVGGVPAGRLVATDFGGELLIISTTGLRPLSNLVVGGSVEDQQLYATRKIGPFFNQLTSLYAHYRGWSCIIHPRDNVLMVTVPDRPGGDTSQVAMSISTKGWSLYRDLPIVSAAVWERDLYFGTIDGRVCRCSVDVDAMALDDVEEFTPIDFSLLTRYTNLDTPTNKQFQTVRPVFLAGQANVALNVQARYDLDLSEPAVPSATGGGAPNSWGVGLWDSTLWGGEFTPSQSPYGISGMGRYIAIALRGKALSRVTLVSLDVMFNTGGVLG